MYSMKIVYLQMMLVPSATGFETFLKVGLFLSLNINVRHINCSTAGKKKKIIIIISDLDKHINLINQKKNHGVRCCKTVMYEH